MALARPLANEPQVIMADEPAGNLDPETRGHVLGFLDEFHRAGKTIIMVPHDPQAQNRPSWLAPVRVQVDEDAAVIHGADGRQHCGP